MKKDIVYLPKDYATAQHTREIPLYFIPMNEVTAGANNCYWDAGMIYFGVTAYTNGYARSHILLPSDYVSGENITFRIVFIINDASGTIDYDVNFYYANESTNLTSTNNPSGQWTANAQANRPTIEDLTITGTNVSASDILRIYITMDDNGAAQITTLMAASLLVPVNTRD